MFTGIVEERGTVRSAGPDRLEVTARTVTGDAAIGASVAVSGVCLTVVASGDDRLAFDVSPETLARTTLGDLSEGDPVNLERPVTPATRLGGHLVQGHVDAVAEVVSTAPEGDGCRMRLRVPAGLDRYLVEKGSVTVDGVSLTVAAIEGDEFEVALIPHTLDVTTLGARESGDRVNLEVDVLAKYLERLTRRDG